MFRLKTFGLGVASVAMMALMGCASTNITNSWVVPDAQPIAFEKTIVVFMNTSETVRRTAEDQLVQRIGADRAVASHSLISQDQVRDSEMARATVDAGGFDGAVVMRVIGRDQQLTYQPGMSYPAHYGGFYSYYGYGWPAVYDPGYLRTDTIVTVETNVYSVADDKLLWSGVSETMNPNDVARAVDDVANAVARELRRQGLVD